MTAFTPVCVYSEPACVVLMWRTEFGATYDQCLATSKGINLR
jgi:hypothetical protein